MMQFQDIVAKYDGYDLDGDGIKEIESLRFLSFENPLASVDPAQKLMVAIVEPRLFANVPGSRYTGDELLERLANLKQDLFREGRAAKFLFLQVKSSNEPAYPGGKMLLAMREFFRDIRRVFTNFEGALLIGSFPDAMVTHLWPEYNTRDKDGVLLKWYGQGGFLFSGPHFDIVLADLDGNWRNLYHESVVLDRHSFFITSDTTVSTSLGNAKVVLTNPRIVLNDNDQPTPGPLTLHDTFFINDALYTVTSLPDGTTRVEFNVTGSDPEVGQQDKGRQNPVATPKICVSRINARSIAVKPPSPLLLDADGKPQQAQGVPPHSVNMEDWHHDPNLERTLLIDYFDRNHAFRSGKFANQSFSISLIEAGLGTTAVNQGLDGLNCSRDEVPNATLLDFTRWLKRPGIFRAIATHADCHSTFFRQDDQQAALLELESGGHPWRWIEEEWEIYPIIQGPLHRRFVPISDAVGKSPIVRSLSKLFAACRMRREFCRKLRQGLL